MIQEKCNNFNYKHVLDSLGQYNLSITFLLEFFFQPFFLIMEPCANMVSTHSQNAKSLMLAYINVETYVMCVKNFSDIFLFLFYARWDF